MPEYYIYNISTFLSLFLLPSPPIPPLQLPLELMTCSSSIIINTLSVYYTHTHVGPTEPIVSSHKYVILELAPWIG